MPDALSSSPRIKASNQDRAHATVSLRGASNENICNVASQKLEGVQSGALNPESKIEVRPVQNATELDQVYRLVHDAFVERKYIRPHADGRLRHHLVLDGIPETTILIALKEGQIIGTNTVTLDSPQGLHVDEDFRTEMNAIRAEGRRLGSSWRIATCRHCRSTTKVVMGLINESMNILLEHMDTCVFTFNPRHERIYRRLLNMETVAHRSATGNLSNAPSVLMRWDIERCPQRWLAASIAPSI